MSYWKTLECQEGNKDENVRLPRREKLRLNLEGDLSTVYFYGGRLDAKWIYRGPNSVRQESRLTKTLENESL